MDGLILTDNFIYITHAVELYNTAIHCQAAMLVSFYVHNTALTVHASHALTNIRMQKGVYTMLYIYMLYRTCIRTLAHPYNQHLYTHTHTPHTHIHTQAHVYMSTFNCTRSSHSLTTHTYRLGRWGVGFLGTDSEQLCQLLRE